MTQAQYIVGVDEVGRGPLAGPVAVCAAMAPESFNFNVFQYLTDSKKLSERRREAIFEQALELQTGGQLRFAVQYEPVEVIDGEGIEIAIRRALEGALAGVRAAKETARIFLDGRLKAPEEFTQETIIGGDGSVPIISLASVIAKVSRDRLMGDLCDHYPEYGFSKHKGYGTSAHIKAIQEYGPCKQHRKSYLSRIVVS